MKAEDFRTFKRLFQQARAIINDSPFCNNFILKKYIHSFQVYRIGLSLLQEELNLKKRHEQFKDLAGKALLFHDVGRFSEIVQLYQENIYKDSNFWFSRRCDHGLLSWETACSLPEYNDERITLPLKHHGHMIESFYQDDAYQALLASAPLQAEEAEQILFLVRDADKLANFYIQKYQDNLHREPFYLTMSPEVAAAPLSPEVFEQFVQHRVILVSTIRSYADRLLCLISWIFDFNFAFSRHIIRKEGYIDSLLQILAAYNHDSLLQQKIADTIEAYFADSTFRPK